MTTATVPAPTAILIRPRDAARLLAISERTLWTLTQRGDIPRVRIGGSVRYRAVDLEAFAARAAQQPPTE